MQYTLRRFRPADQPAVKALVLAGLAEHFPNLDDTLNPDLNDIQRCYIESGGDVWVVNDSNIIIGCGALVAEKDAINTWHIVRVSVHRDYRRQQIGQAISHRLLAVARCQGASRVLVETNHDWTGALRLYQSLGFVEFDRRPVPEFGYTEVHMQRRI